MDTDTAGYWARSTAGFPNCGLDHIYAGGHASQVSDPTENPGRPVRAPRPCARRLARRRPQRLRQGNDTSISDSVMARAEAARDCHGAAGRAARTCMGIAAG